MPVRAVSERGTVIVYRRRRRPRRALWPDRPNRPRKPYAVVAVFPVTSWLPGFPRLAARPPAIVGGSQTVPVHILGLGKLTVAV